MSDSDLDEEEEEDFVLVEKSQVPRVTGAQSARRWSLTVSNFGRDYPAISEGFKVTMEVAGFPFNILLEIPNLGDRIDWLRTCSKEELYDWVWDQVIRAIWLGGAFAVGRKLQIPMSPLVAGICLVIQKMVERADSPPPETQREPADEKTETLEVNGQRVTFTFVDVNTDSGQPQKPTPEPEKESRPALFNLRFEPEDIKNAPHHPLEHSWTLWCASPKTKFKFKSKQQDWGSSIRPIYTFSTIEDFWGIYNNMRPPSKLEPGWDIYCFKRQIEPKWEDPVCANGGKWALRFSKGKSDLSWQHTLLALIGEQFDRGDEICGAVVNVRHGQEKIALWTKNAANEAAQVSIGKQWKAILDSNETIGYIIHEDARQQERSAKSKYVV